MSASITDRFNKAADGNGAYPVLGIVSATRQAGDKVLSCQDLTGWTTQTAVHFSTYRLDASGAVDTTTQTDWKGIVSGSTIINLTRIAGAADDGNQIGDIVELNPTIGWLDDIITGLLKTHTQTGELKDGIIKSPNVDWTTMSQTGIGGKPMAMLLRDVPRIEGFGPSIHGGTQETTIIDGTKAPENTSIVSFYNGSDGVDENGAIVFAEIGIVTFSNSSALVGKIVKRYRHGNYGSPNHGRDWVTVN